MCIPEGQPGAGGIISSLLRVGIGGWEDGPMKPVTKAATRFATTLSAATLSATDLPHVPDESLLRRFQLDRDEGAFRALVYRYQQILFTFLRRRLGQHELAEEAFQETFLSVYRHAHQFDATRSFRPWLFAIAANQATTMQRRRAREFRVTNAAHVDETRAASGTMYIETLAVARGPSADEIAATRESNRLVRLALLRLTAPQRLIISLIFGQGYKYREAAEVLGIPVGTVKSRLHAAIRRMAAIGGAAGA